MRDERIVWAIVVAVVSTLLLLKDTWHYYAVSGVIVAISFVMLVCKPCQHSPQTGGLAMSTPDTQDVSHATGFFHNARNIVINNSTMTDIQAEDKTPRIMDLLSNHIILGAAHDDCARAYPPRCHPGTRINILERLAAWFYNIDRAKSVFWLSGPAGVGKSAIMQTFAESVKQPVASVFVSRPNKRNDPNLIIPTLAYQLAVCMEPYHNYVIDRLAANPYILKKNMQMQFQVFIVEPFVEMKIGAGGPPVALLLDGLDEIEGPGVQRDIIRLITTFTKEHTDVPLAWILASRPEPHISNTFDEIAVRGGYETKFIPIDSKDACEDVERFLRASFETVRHEFPSTTPKNWPEETALAKLANAASGLFIFAETAIRFIRDPDYANPIPRLQLVLSVIDRLKSISIKERPFALLDNLYTEILSNIPSGSWPTTKLLLRLVLSFRNNNFLGLPLWSKSRTLRGMIMILQLDHYTVYAALNKCFSVLRIPLWEEAHEKRLTFLHASFADYLMDSKRSGEFYIDVEGAEEDVLLFYLDLWHKHFEGGSSSSDNLVIKRDYESLGIPPEKIDEFNTGIIQNMAGTILTQIVERHKPQPVVSPALLPKRLECLHSLRRVDMISLSNSKYLGSDQLTIYSLDPRKHLFSFAERTFGAWKNFPYELGECGILRQVAFKDISFDYHNREAYRVASFVWELADSAKTLPEEESMESFLKRSPELPVLICGVVPEGRIAFFKANESGTKYCIIPYRA